MIEHTGKNPGSRLSAAHPPAGDSGSTRILSPCATVSCSKKRKEEQRRGKEDSSRTTTRDTAARTMPYEARPAAMVQRDSEDPAAGSVR